MNSNRRVIHVRQTLTSLRRAHLATAKMAVENQRESPSPPKRPARKIPTISKEPSAEAKVAEWLEKYDSVQLEDENREEAAAAAITKEAELNQLFESMKSVFECGICKDVLIKAISLNCMHTFCCLCITRWLDQNNTCPMCRKYVTHMRENHVINGAVDKMVGRLLSEEEQADRLERGRVAFTAPSPAVRITSSHVEIRVALRQARGLPTVVSFSPFN